MFSITHKLINVRLWKLLLINLLSITTFSKKLLHLALCITIRYTYFFIEKASVFLKFALVYGFILLFLQLILFLFLLHSLKYFSL